MRGFAAASAATAANQRDKFDNRSVCNDNHIIEYGHDEVTHA
jgi:hypothetical protein